MTAPPRADLMAAAATAPGIVGRVLPNDIEAERAVLGCLLLDIEAVHAVRDVLRPDDFYAEKHQHLYRAAVTLADRGEPVDMLTLPDQLERGPGVGRAGGMDYIAELTLVVPSAASVKHYADIVNAHAQRRRLIQAGGEVSRLGFDLGRTIEDAVDEAEQTVFAVKEQQRTDTAIHIAPIVRETWALLEHRLHENKLVHGVPTNFSKLDMLTQGLQPGELIILAARPSVGKTSFALNIARNAAVLARRPVVVFSLEMSKQSLVQRLICSEAKVDSYLLRTGQADPSAFQKIAMAMDTLTQADLWIDDTPALTIMSLRSRARRMKAQYGIALIVVDYLQLMHGGRQDSRVQEVSDISSGLKSIAKELDVPVLALSQLSRESERRENKRPQLSDLRDSGCLVGTTEVFLPATGGSLPISELVGARDFEILALNEATWKLERRRVSRVFPTGHRPVFELETKLGRRIRATANHEFLAFEGWRRLDALREGQHIALPRSLPASARQTIADARLALIGHLIGDGCTLPRHSIQYTTADRVLADLVASLAVEAFGVQIRPRIRKERGWYQVYLSAATRLTHGKRNAIASWLDELEVFGLRSYEKRVPRAVFEQPSDQIALFLRHLWATDGCVHIGDSPRAIPRIYYASSSERLALDVQSLLLRLGVTARVRRASQSHRGRPHFHTLLSGIPDVRVFLDRVGPLRPSAVVHADRIRLQLLNRNGNTNRDVIPNHAWALYATPALLEQGISQRGLATRMGRAYNGTAVRRAHLSRERAAELAAVVAAPTLTALSESDVYWDQIASISPAGEADVFDITVDDDLHNFVAGDLVVHNSIEQDADVVLFLYREGLHNREVDRAKTDLIVAKNRNGPVDDLKLVFIDSQTAFREPYMDSD